MLPILELLSNNVNWQVGELRNHLAAVLDLTDEEIHERYEGGGKSILATRVQFALMDLRAICLVIRPTEGIPESTDTRVGVPFTGIHRNQSSDAL